MCPDGSFASGANCTQCSPLCSTCNGPSSGDCIVCGAGQYARVIGFVEPMEMNEETGKDIEFVNQVMGGNIPSNYIPACEKVRLLYSTHAPMLTPPSPGLLRGAREGLALW